MRNRNHHHQDSNESFDHIEWPDAEVGVDDEAFAEAIANGRGEDLAA